MEGFIAEYDDRLVSIEVGNYFGRVPAKTYLHRPDTGRIQTGNDDAPGLFYTYPNVIW